MECPHCKENLGMGDAYDLMILHSYHCNSKEGDKLNEAREKSYDHGDYCTCEDCI